MITPIDNVAIAEERIRVDIAIKKHKNKIKREQSKRERDKIRELIKVQYPSGLDEVKHKNLIRDGVKIIPLCCSKCSSWKIFPFDFIGLNGRDYGTNKCNLCTYADTRVSKKYQDSNRIKCECGICYIGTDNSIAKHMISKQHMDRVSEMIKGVRYTKGELIKLCSYYSIPYYKGLNYRQMIDILRPKMEIDIKTDVRYVLNK
jgi:hypothetical protein